MKKNTSNNENKRRISGGGGSGTAGTSPNKTSSQQQQHHHRPSLSKPTTRMTSSNNHEDITLLAITGTGTTNIEKNIIRHSADQILQFRLQYLDAPIHWTPHNRCLWKSSDRRTRIELHQAMVYNFKPLQINELTRWKPKSIQHPSNNNTNNCNDTKQQDSMQQLHSSMEQEKVSLDKINGILNKLSWTNLDKLVVQFVQALVPPISLEMVNVTMQRVVQKAMLEPHFAELYARLSVKLSMVHKAFKKTVLRICQEQFELTGPSTSNSSSSAVSQPPPIIPTTTNNTKNEQENHSMDSTMEAVQQQQQQQQDATNTGKKAIGLMTFIGELYVQKLIKVGIMLSCLQRLLVPTDEERLESFCKLMTTIGKRMHTEDLSQDEIQIRQQLWDQVYSMADRKKSTTVTTTTQDNAKKTTSTIHPKAPSIRLKFLLQALIELQENNWITIRHEHEKAKTIQQIHQEAAEEAKHGPIVRTASTLKRSQSTGTVQPKNTNYTSSANNNTNNKSTTIPENEMEKDGFITVPPKPQMERIRRAKSEAPIRSSLQKASGSNYVGSSGGSGSAKTKQQVAVSSLASSSMNDTTTTSTNLGGNATASPKTNTTTTPTNSVGVKECNERSRTIFKEYFIGGDRENAVLSIQELVGGNSGGSSSRNSTPSVGYMDRAVAVIQSGILLVLEMKEIHVHKFLDVVSRCLDNNVIDRKCLIPAIQEPLEYLRDIEIDAPRSSEWLAIIVAEWMTKKVDDGETAMGGGIEILLQAPTYFLSDAGRPTEFAVQVLLQIYHPNQCGTTTSATTSSISVLCESERDVLNQLWTEQERKQYGSIDKIWETKQAMAISQKQTK